MASLLEQLKCNRIFWKKIYAESQRYYKKVVRFGKELKQDHLKVNLYSSIVTDYNTMEMNPDSAQGKLSDTFVTRKVKIARQRKTRG